VFAPAGRLAFLERRLSGWAAMMGRQPTPDDLIVPLPPQAADRRRTRTGDPFRSTDYSFKRWTYDDLPALGLRHRRHYDMRVTFITLAIEDGADPDTIEARVTHTKKARRAFEGYVRTSVPQWAKTCAEVTKLRAARRLAISFAALVELSSVVGSGGGGSRKRPGCSTVIRDASHLMRLRVVESHRVAPRTKALHQALVQSRRATWSPTGSTRCSRRGGPSTTSGRSAARCSR